VSNIPTKWEEICGERLQSRELNVFKCDRTADRCSVGLGDLLTISTYNNAFFVRMSLIPFTSK
jgi:hypothetical protein